MTRKYIGLLSSNKLNEYNFINKNTQSFKDCITLAKSNDKNFIAIKPDNSNNDVINTQGQCYVGNYNPTKDESILDEEGDFEIYGVPDENPCNDDCLNKSIDKNYWKDRSSDLSNQLEKIQEELRKAKIKNYEISQGVNENTAKNAIKTSELEKKHSELRDQLNSVNQHYESVSTSSQNSNILLADKNRLIAGVNSSIQQKQQKLNEVNSRINTYTQDIYENNLEYENKQQIVKTLRAIVIVLIIMAFILIIYYGIRYAQQKYPNSLNSFNTFMNNSPFQ